MFAVEGKKNRIAAAHSLSQFIECAVNIYLRSRKLFPEYSFTQHMRFGQSFSLCSISEVKKYIKQVSTSIQTLLVHDRVERFIIQASDSESEPIERFTLEFPCDFGKTLFYSLSAENGLRSDLTTNSFSSEILREALSHLEKKVRRNIDPTSKRGIASWEVLVEVKRSSAQATECMEMPSGWTLLEEGRGSTQKFQNVARQPIKSSCIQDSVVVLSYVDFFADR